jgi:hypothetical protein
MLRRVCASISCSLALLLFFSAAPHLAAQSRRADTLSPGEVQQLRDNAVHPATRIKLYIGFIDRRLQALQHLVSDTGAAHRDMQIHNRLDEITHLSDELQDNIDTYDSQHADIRKPLKKLISASAKWPGIISSIPQNSNYEFAQKLALESVRSANKEATRLSTEQDAFFKIHKKLRKTNGYGPQG